MLLIAVILAASSPVVKQPTVDMDIVTACGDTRKVKNVRPKLVITYLEQGGVKR